MLQGKIAIPHEHDPYYGYDKFVAGRPTTSASVSETILQSPERIWALVRDFGRIDEWWKGFFTDLRMVHGAPTDSVGAERAFNGNGVSYREVLLLNDDEEMRHVYGLTYASSPHILAAVTTIDVDPVPGASDKCTVTWSSVSQPALSCRIVANEIRERQLRAYTNGLRSLQSYYKSELGSVEVSIQTGRLALPGRHHLHLSVGFTEIMVPLTRKGSPQKNEKYKYSIFSEGDDLLFELVDCSSEKISALGSLVLSGLSKTTHVKVPIRNHNGDTIGAFVVEITVTRPTAEAAAPNPATAVGTVVLAVAKDLQRKVQEIAAYMAQQLLNPGKEEVWEYASYNGETGDEPFGRLPKYCKILPYSSVIQPKRTGELFQRSTEYLYSQAILLGVENPLDLVEDGDPYKLPFRNWMPTPQKVIDRHKDDEEIAAQLLRGVNPVKITLATSVYDLPAEFQSLYVAAEGRSLRDLAGSKRIFYCDYWEVAVGEYNEEGGYYSHQAMAPANLGTLGPLKYWYAPFLVVYKRENGDLNLVGFTLTRYSDKPNVVFTPNSHPPNIYQLAKFHLTCADNQHHQFCTHLGLAHLVMEPFAVANNNVFMNVKDGKPHPVGALLEPHFKDTVGINFLARQTLVSEVAPLTDATFSPGTVNGMKIFSKSYENWDVVGDNFVNALRKRGFDEGCSDELPNYYYREDGFKVWNILLDFIGSVVEKIYPTDAAVGADEKLSQWCEELRDPKRGDLRTFPASISSRSFLTEILTSIVFYCSAQHSAVNFAQLRYVSYVPNRPDSMTKPMPADLNTEIGLEELYSALPSFINGEFQTLFAYLLTTPPDNPFSEYLGVEKDFPEEAALLRDNMDKLHLNIRARNKALEAEGKIGYEFLDPVNIAQSINI